LGDLEGSTLVHNGFGSLDEPEGTIVKGRVFGLLVELAMVTGMVNQPGAEAQTLPLYPLLECVGCLPFRSRI
jgi:hypothetical protein